MTSDSPPPELRQAALRAFALNERRQPIADLVEDREMSDSMSAENVGRLWRFAADDLRIELQLSATAEGWVATTRVIGQSSFIVTAFRSERACGSFEAKDGQAALGLLAAGPLSLTYHLEDGREVQSSWTTVPSLGDLSAS